MYYKFTLEGEVPAKKNSRIVLKNGKNIPSERYKEWHSHSFFEIQKQKIQQDFDKPIENPCKILIAFSHGDLKRRDCDNGISSLLDLLVDCHVLADDNWKIVESVMATNLYNKGNAFCTLTIFDADS